jgi:hypothetical protein
MKRTKITVVAAAFAMGLGLSALTGCASNDEKPAHYTNASAGEQFADVAAVRPMTFTYGLVGALVWVATLPFSIPAGNADELGQTLVVDPMKYTFMRPVGDMSKDAEPAYTKAE